MATSGAPSRSSRPLLGVLFMCTACALFPIMNGLVKLLAATYDPQEIVWFRIVMHLVLVAVPFPHPQEAELRKVADAAGVAQERLHFAPPVEQHELAYYLSGADVAVSAIP